MWPVFKFINRIIPTRSLAVYRGNNNALKKTCFVQSNCQCGRYLTENSIFNMSCNSFTLVRLFSVTCQSFAKSRDKGEKKKGGKAGPVNLNELREALDVDSYMSRLDHSIEDLKNNFIKHLTLRSGGSIEQVSVTFEGEEYVVQDLAQVAHKPKLTVLNVSAFPQAIPDILDALNKSGMNINPQQDGTTLFIPTPKVTKEHRESLAKNAKALYIKCRDNLKDIRNKEVKNLKKVPSISEDQIRRFQTQLDAICDKYVKNAEEILDTKQKELIKSD